MVSYMVMRDNIFFFSFKKALHLHYIPRIILLTPEDLEIQVQFPVLYYQKQVYNISIFTIFCSIHYLEMLF
jgi:hypothetical protein